MRYSVSCTAVDEAHLTDVVATGSLFGQSSEIRHVLNIDGVSVLAISGADSNGYCPPEGSSTIWTFILDARPAARLDEKGICQAAKHMNKIPQCQSTTTL